MDKYSYLSNVDGAWLDDLYQQYLKDPASVEAEWRGFFSALQDDPETVKARELIKKAGIHYKVGEYEPAIAAYKERKAAPGIFAVRCAATGGWMSAGRANSRAAMEASLSRAWVPRR